MAWKPGRRAGLTILPDKRQASSRLFPLAASTAETKPPVSPVIFRGSAGYRRGGVVRTGCLFPSRRRDLRPESFPGLIPSEPARSSSSIRGSIPAGVLFPPPSSHPAEGSVLPGRPLSATPPSPEGVCWDRTVGFSCPSWDNPPSRPLSIPGGGGGGTG